MADSLTALPLLRDHGVRAFIDLGSGGGYPGLPLAATLPVDRALLVDSVARKARFLATAVEAVGAARRIGIRADRAESLAAPGRERGRWPAATARAVAPLAELVELALPLLTPRGILIAWKSGDPGDQHGLGAEVAAARRALAVVDPGGRLDVHPAVGHLAQPAVRDLADHRLIVVERSRVPIDARWPRGPAARRRQPW